MDTTLDGKVVLVKGKHRYEFRYQQGSELAALDAFVALAGNTQSNFDWFDAAVLSYQISKNFSPADELAEQDDNYSQFQDDSWA